MNAVVRYLDSYRRREDDGACLPDWYIRQVLGEPKSGPVAVANARQSALSLEEDREASRGY